MNIFALLYPVICYGIYYFLLNFFSSTLVLFDLLIGAIFGFYVVVMRRSSFRRIIALIHSILIIILFCFNIEDISLWVYLFGGLSIALTRHNHIQPLCPMPKTRMIIMTCMPLLGIVLFYLPFTNVYFACLIHGVLLGFYLWMKERLNDENRQLVTLLTTFFMLALSLWWVNEYQYIWIMWAVFSQIIQLFKVKFILCSQN